MDTSAFGQSVSWYACGHRLRRWQLRRSQSQSLSVGHLYRTSVDNSAAEAAAKSARKTARAICMQQLQRQSHRQQRHQQPMRSRGILSRLQLQESHLSRKEHISARLTFDRFAAFLGPDEEETNMEKFRRSAVECYRESIIFIRLLKLRSVDKPRL